jgi:hypothetical protein
MPHSHIIAAGDWLGDLADRYGIGHWSHIWNDESNSELKHRRGSPDLLMIGDVVQIPDAPPREAEVPAGRRAVFVVRSSQERLRVRVTGLARFVEFFGPVSFDLRAGDVSVAGELTKDDSVIELPLHVAVQSATLILMGTQRFEMKIGGLGPADESRGAFARLESLGFTVAIDESPPEARTREQAVDPLCGALLAFQTRLGLERSGRLDDVTFRALVSMYGS